MNSQQILVKKHNGANWFGPLVKIASLKTPIEIRQLLLISRIMMSLLTTGLIGYTLDRLMQSVQKSSISA